MDINEQKELLYTHRDLIADVMYRGLESKRIWGNECDKAIEIIATSPRVSYFTLTSTKLRNLVDWEKRKPLWDSVLQEERWTHEIINHIFFKDFPEYELKYFIPKLVKTYPDLIEVLIKSIAKYYDLSKKIQRLKLGDEMREKLIGYAIAHKLTN